jgi:NDP-sugar pyrophosphorylase family protein
MKALILAAGFGTRLLPYTKNVPKPMFTIDSIPVLGHTIQKLIDSGCSEIFINTHHLHEQIENYIKKSHFAVDITTIFEPEILDTGGAVKNIKPLIKNSTFIVINGDILYDLDLAKIVKNNNNGNHLASLVLHKHDQFNKIELDEDNFILNFNSSKNPYAFTGIHILSPDIFNFMPDENIFSIIDLYKSMIKERQRIKAIILAKNYFWEDIGNINDYKHSCMKYLARFAIKKNKIDLNKIKIDKLAGDGSDREWFRITLNNKTYIAADHGINVLQESNVTTQLDSFINIGNHLHKNDLPVPEILNFDKFAGIALVDDLGDSHLENHINEVSDNTTIYFWYKKVCDSLYAFSKKGYQGFNFDWAFETNEYSKEMILERECKYFINSFVNGFLEKDVRFDTFADEFEYLAENCLNSSYTGLMHRDMQSKNIMVCDNNIFFIDFQSARKGPLEYDMASLLIDPYVQLDTNMKNKILDYMISKISNYENLDAKLFKHCYKYCCITRNLQILGAFSYLSRIKKKKTFENFIPYALTTLKHHISLINANKIPKLNNLINNMRV